MGDVIDFPERRRPQTSTPHIPAWDMARRLGLTASADLAAAVALAPLLRTLTPALALACAAPTADA